MKSHIYGGTTLNQSTTATNYNWIASTNLAAWNATQTNRDTVVPHALTLDQLRITVVTAPGASKSYAYTVMKNGVATALTCTVSGTSLAAQDLSNTVTFAAGDTISLRAAPSGTPTVPSGVFWSIRQDATDLFAVIGGASQNAANNGNNYDGLMSSAGWMATESSVYSPIPTSGVLKNLYIMSSAAPAGVTDRAFTIMVNGSPSSVTCSLGSSGTTANDTTNTVSVSAGDTVSIRSSVTGLPAAANIAWACSFDPTTDGESFLLYGDSASPSTSATNYEQPLGRGVNAWSATESARFIALAATTIKSLYTVLTVAPGGSSSYGLTARLNATTTASTVTVSGANTTANITGLSVTVSDDAQLSLESIPTSTPVSTAIKTGILLYISSASGTTVTPSTASLTTATFAPTVSVTSNVTVTPSTASLTLTRFAPTVQTPVLVMAGLLTLSLSTFAPTVSVANNQTVTPSTASLTITSFAPTVSVSNNQTVTPPTASLTLSRFAPTVTATNNITVIPATASLSTSLFTPTVSAASGVVVTPTTASLTTTTLAPTVLTPRLVTPSTAILTTSTFAPTVSTPRTVTPGVVSLVLSTFAPTVTALADQVVTPGTAALILITYAPSIAAHIPTGDGIDSIIWEAGNDPNAASMPIGNSIGSATFSPASIGTTTIGAGDSVGSAVWIPGDQI